MKKIFIVLALLGSLVNAEKLKAPKMGCILAQDGNVSIDWVVYSHKHELGIQGTFESVNYTPIVDKGHNFKTILVGSTMDSKTGNPYFQNKRLHLKISDIQAIERIKRGPRHGIITFDITLGEITREVPAIYFYEGGNMSMQALINLKDYTLTKQTTYAQLKVDFFISSLVCAVEH